MSKSEKRSIGGNYCLEVYWKGKKDIEKEIKIKRLKVKVDGKVYKENDN
ncbi:DUF4944 domain-containing protein [Bacillus pumilus]|nr:DUF4944 domain-containing protein [Bacillus pumilus]